MTKELSGKPVVITGAGQGLGRAYALAIAAAGGRVLVNDRNGANAHAVVREIVALGGEAIASSDPVGTAESAAAIVGQCVEAFGSVHGLINNAAIWEERLSWDESPAYVEALVRANLLGTWYTGLAVMEPMRRAGSGVIVNVTSGAMLGVPTMALYGASKAGIASLTVSWAQELFGSGVRVHGIAPWALTPMQQVVRSELRAKHGPEIAAPLAVYLLTDLAAPLNGQVVRTAEGKISLYRPGSFGEVLGERMDWTTETLHATLDGRGGGGLGFLPQNAND